MDGIFFYQLFDNTYSTDLVFNVWLQAILYMTLCRGEIM